MNQKMGLYSVWYTCSAEQEQQAIDLLVVSMRRSTRTATFAESLIIADTSESCWYTLIKHMNHLDTLCTVHVGTCSIQAGAQGDFTHRSGSYTYYYISRGICYALDVKANTVRCMVDIDISCEIESDILVTGYKTSDSSVLEVMSCIDVDKWALHGSRFMGHLVESNSCFLTLIKGDVKQWKSFTPRGQSVVTKSSSLLWFVSDTKQIIIFIYGKPRQEYDILFHRVCWIYDSKWDDDRTIDFHGYGSMEEAVKTVLSIDKTCVLPKTG